MGSPRSAFGASPPEGGAASGRAEPDPRRLLACIDFIPMAPLLRQRRGGKLTWKD